MNNLLISDWKYRLFDDNQKIFLAVLCGGVGQHEIIIELNENEIKNFRELGQVFIDSLSDDILKNSLKYSKRRIQ